MTPWRAASPAAEHLGDVLHPANHHPGSYRTHSGWTSASLPTHTHPSFSLPLERTVSDGDRWWPGPSSAGGLGGPGRAYPPKAQDGADPHGSRRSVLKGARSNQELMSTAFSSAYVEPGAAGARWTTPANQNDRGSAGRYELAPEANEGVEKTTRPYSSGGDARGVEARQAGTTLSPWLPRIAIRLVALLETRIQMGRHEMIQAGERSVVVWVCNFWDCVKLAFQM